MPWSGLTKTQIGQPRLSVRDAIISNHVGIVRKRTYPERDAVLRKNQELQKNDLVKPTDGMRPFARFPEHELERLAEKGRTDKSTPSWYADLTSRDPQISSRAKQKLVNSSEGAIYRVGQTSRKMFSMPKYKFVGNGKYEAL